MRRLLHVISFTADLDRSKRFYRDGLGLDVVAETPYAVDFSIDGAGLMLLAIHPYQRSEVELCFEAPRVEDTVRTLRERGVQFMDEVRELAFGSVVHFRDPESNLLSLLQPAAGSRLDAGGDAGGSRPAETAAGNRPRLATAIVSTRDVMTARAFYRDRLGLHVTVDSPWWTQFDTGGLTLAIHARPRRAAAEQPPGQQVSFGFDVPDLGAWVESARARGVAFVSVPTDESFGLQAEAVDPEGNAIVAREPLAQASLEERLAEMFEDDDAPHLVAIRRPVRRGTHAMSRVVIRPEYKPARKAGARKKVAAPKRRRSIPSVRGSGAVRSRVSPKKLSDPERVKTRPAIGRLKKARNRTLTEKKRAVARASRVKPVKRKAAKTPRRRGR